MIAEMRAQLKSDLETGSDGAAAPVGVTVHDVFPGKVSAPCCIIGYEPGSYLTGGQTFGNSYQVALMVVCLVPRSETQATDLEALVERVLANTVDWGLTGADSPVVFALQGQEFLGTTVHLTKQGKLS